MESKKGRRRPFCGVPSKVPDQVPATVSPITWTVMFDTASECTATTSG
jgi:hypothetical protein